MISYSSLSKVRLSRTLAVEAFELWVIRADTKIFVSMTAYTIAFFSKSSDFSDFFVNLIEGKFWRFTSFRFSSKFFERCLCFCSHFVFFFLGLDGERDALTANYSLDKDVDGGIRAHTELFTEFIKLCFLLVVHTDCHCCLCHKPEMFV